MSRDNPKLLVARGYDKIGEAYGRQPSAISYQLSAGLSGGDGYCDTGLSYAYLPTLAAAAA